ncbi:hypothetical protein GW17_00038341 [Ensete ventricosum]|nr:hypothetical protein GW17_00038341 [Ensete ventricosum]
MRRIASMQYLDAIPVHGIANAPGRTLLSHISHSARFVASSPLHRKSNELARSIFPSIPRPIGVFFVLVVREPRSRIS